MVHHLFITLGAPFKAPIDQKCNQDNQILLSRTFLGDRGDQSPEIYHLFSPPDFYYLFPLLGWRITHSSPQGSPSEPQNDQKCHQDNQILLSRPFHGEGGEQLPGIYHLLSLPDLSYSIPLLGWYITQPSPQGPLSERQSDQKWHHDNQISLSKPLHRERGERSPKIYHLLVLLICPTSTPSWGGASPINHSRGPF